MKFRNNLKRAVSLLMTVMLVLGMGITALADDPAPTTFKITVPSDDNHTYAVYQIFTGDYAKETVDGKDVEYLSNVKWGQNGSLPTGASVGDNVSADILATLQSASGNDKQLLGVIKDYVDLSGTAFKTVSKDSEGTVPTGYYLIKDKDAVTGDDAATLYIVQVVGDVTISRKADKPEVDKKVQENSTSAWGGHADYNIGDDVPFELIGTLPDNYDMYDTYKYIFHDTLSNGLTYNNDFKVYAVNAADVDGDMTGATEITAHFAYVAETAMDGAGLKFSCNDLKKAVAAYSADIRIVVRYTAKLNGNAVIGNSGNPNKVKLEFSNNPNSGGEGDTGETPEKKVVVFTFELDGNKVDGKDTSKNLEGAEFKLYRLKSDGTTKEWIQITDGIVSGWTTTEDDGTVLTSDANGLFQIPGLDAGTYYLKETKAPTGYNLLEDEITITVTPGYKTTDADGTIIETLTGTVLVGTESDQNKPTDVTATTAVDGKITGKLGFQVQNNKGSTLPETGGIGTTIFYVLGGIMVLGCGVILYARKRMERK